MRKPIANGLKPHAKAHERQTSLPRPSAIRELMQIVREGYGDYESP